MPETKKFTVVGFYEDTEQRFCETVDAADSAEAEKEVFDSHPDSDLIITGVLKGECECADLDTPFISSYQTR